LALVPRSAITPTPERIKTSPSVSVTTAGTTAAPPAAGLTGNITITNPDAQQQAVDGVKTDITTETAAANSGAIKNNFDRDEVFKELNLQVSVTRDFKENANRQIGEYLDDKQAAARKDLQDAIDKGDKAKQDAAIEDIYKLQYQRRFLQTLVGIVAGSPDAAITRHAVAGGDENARRDAEKLPALPGVVDKDGNVISNVSGPSDGLYDGVKLGGVRVGLDFICGDKNIRCVNDENNNHALILDDKGRVQYKGDERHKTFDALLEDRTLSDGLYGPTGGFRWRRGDDEQVDLFAGLLLRRSGGKLCRYP
jgi:filamentous hemagglutinin